MNGLLLLAGLSPLIIFSIIFMIKKKSYLFPAIALTCSCAIAVIGFFIPSGTSSGGKLSTEWLNYLANINMASGNLTKAEDYLNDMYLSSGDCPETLVTGLRLSLLKGDTDTACLIAKTLSLYMGDNDVVLNDFEKTFVDDADSGSILTSDTLSANQAMYNQLASSNVKPEDYGYEKISDDAIASATEIEEKRKEEVLSAINEAIDSYNASDDAGKTIRAAVDTASKLQSTYNEMINSGSSTDSYVLELKKLTTLLHAAYTKNPDVFNLPEIHDAYILGLTATEDYSPLIEYAVSSNDATAIATVANLYLGGKITEKDFPNDFADTTDYENVIEKCTDILNNLNTDDFSNAEISDFKNSIEAIIAKNNNPLLAELEKQLEPENANDTDKAGLYIQDSGLNSELSDKKSAFDSLNQALENLGKSDNENLKNALDEISSIVDNNSASDSITNLNSHLTNAYKSSLPLHNDLITVPESYLNTSNSYVNEKRAMINIGIVNTENFSEIKAYVSSSGVDLTNKENIVITDCGVVIDDYAIEKVVYDSAKIFLVCDNSGSMSYDIDALKNAVEKFVKSKNSKEQISIITFDSSVINNTGLTTDSSILQSAIDGFGAYGGTNIGSGVDSAFETLSSGNSFNAIIVMTDGQDSSYSSSSALNDLRKKCLENNVILYTIGLGSVNTDYLEAVADSGMGSFIYSSDSVQLEELYSFIHNQLDNNYVITYKAKDTTTANNRLLSISNTKEGYTGKRYYSLSYDNEDTSSDKDSLNSNPDGISIKRLGISTIIKGASETAEFTILGSGFDKAEAISVSVSGKKQYSNLAYTITNDMKLTVSLPANTAYDTYDVIIGINGSSYTLSGLSVLEPGSSSSITFGDYIFSAMSIETNGNTTTLKGNVVMNDYLHFKGDITLTGNLSGNTLVLEDKNGSYIAYTDSLPGLLGLFFDNTMSLPAISGVTLYSNGSSFDKYYAYGKSYYGPLEIYDPYIEIHPEYIQMTLCKVSFDFPLLNNLLDYVDSPINASGVEKSVVLSKEKPGIVYSLNPGFGINGTLKLGPAKLSISGFELNIDTIQNNYSLAVSVEVGGVSIFNNTDGTEFTLSVGIKSGKFDSISLGTDLEFSLIKTPPVTFTDFEFGVEGLVSENQDATLAQSLLGATWYGQCAIQFFNLNEVIPGLDTFLGNLLDISILSLDETKLSLTLSNFNVSLDSTAKLLEIVELGKIEIDIGNYKYENYLLGINSSVAGVHAKVSNDINLEFSKNLKFNMSGSSQIDINNKFAGVMTNGTIDYRIKVFKTFTGDLEGNFLLGIHNNASQFTLLIKGDDYSSGKDNGVRVTFKKGSLLPDVTLY